MNAPALPVQYATPEETVDLVECADCNAAIDEDHLYEVGARELCARCAFTAAADVLERHFEGRPRPKDDPVDAVMTMRDLCNAVELQNRRRSVREAAGEREDEP